jgi:hypothetical protein
VSAAPVALPRSLCATSKYGGLRADGGRSAGHGLRLIAVAHASAVRLNQKEEQMKNVHSASIYLTIAGLAGAVLSLAAVTTTTAAPDEQKTRGAPNAPQFPDSQGSCNPTQKKFKVSTLEFNTTSITAQAVPDTNINFVQGGTGASCVIIYFSSEASAVANERGAIRAEIDNVTESCDPTYTYFHPAETNPSGLGARAFNFVCPDVSPGGHVAKIKYQSESGGNVKLGFRTTIVEYK